MSSDDEADQAIAGIQADMRADEYNRWAEEADTTGQGGWATVDTIKVPGPLYVDLAALIAAGLPKAPPPRLLTRQDGSCLLYAGKVNVLFGDPESGKSWVALAAAQEALSRNLRAAYLDLDHNGAVEIASRLLYLGATPAQLSNPDLFRLYEPADSKELLAGVHELQLWRPACAVVDSLGEVLPMLGLKSVDNDDYTQAHRQVLSALADAGAAVIAVDHLPKDADARNFGQIGASAKLRAINGVSLRVTVKEAFAPGRGGACDLKVWKDRSGGVRENCPAGEKNPAAGRFVLQAHQDGTGSWFVTKPVADGPTKINDMDLAEVESLVLEINKPPTKRLLQDRLGWGSNRAMAALKGYRELRKHDDDDDDDRY